MLPLQQQRANPEMSKNEIMPPAANASVRPFRVTTGAELFQMPADSTEWLVQGLIPAVGTSLIGAPPKAGKSCFTRQLCAFVQMGLPFLGRDVKQAKTLYFSTQERCWPIAEHFRSLGCTEETMPDLIAGEKFDQREALERLAQTVAGVSGLKLVVVDMIGDFLPLKDSNDYQETTRKFAPLRQLAEQYSIHLCVTTHTKKAQTDNPVHAVIGSQAIAGAVDQVVILNNDSRQQRTITTIQRYGESIPLTLLNWATDRRAMFLGKNADEARADQKKDTVDRITRELMVYITGNPGCTKEEVLGAVRGDATAKRKALSTLMSEGYLVRSGSGQKGDPYVYTMSDESDLLAAQAA